MDRFRKVVLVVMALCLAAIVAAGGATAKPQSGKGAKKPRPVAARLDSSFGRGGVARIATSKLGNRVRMAVAPGGRVYVLQSPMVLAFEADGKPARSFGNNGRVRIASGAGEPSLENLAIDSQGRVLVVGTTNPGGSESPTKPVPVSESYAGSTATLSEALVVRLGKDGSLDPSFGDAGEVAGTFGLPKPTGAPGKGVEYASPIVTGTTISVDSQDRPIFGGAYAKEVYFCGYRNIIGAGYTARLNASGSLDTGYGAGRGFVSDGTSGTVKAMAGTPEGGVATISTGSHCGAKEFAEESTFDLLTQSGASNPILDPARPRQYLLPTIALDSQGRSLLVQTPGTFAPGPSVLTRRLPNGDIDPSFGFSGGIPLPEIGQTVSLAVDAKGRTLVARGEKAPEVTRYTTAGKRDGTFGHKGLLKGGGAGNESGLVDAVAIDARGRIYTAGSINNGSLKTGMGIQITRFLPGS